MEPGTNQINEYGIRNFERQMRLKQSNNENTVQASVFNFNIDRSNIVDSIINADNKKVVKKPDAILRKIIVGIIITVIGGSIVWSLTII